MLSHTVNTYFILTFSLVSLLFCTRNVIGDENNVRIKSVTSFKNFVNEVNSENDYSGTTVYLDSDLSLSGETLEPIGKDSTYYFRGVFDGQGHIISGLEISSSSSEYAGLFGYSEGLTIRNIVLDSSCSITNSYSGSDDVYVGGIIGECNGYDGQCNIENSVNMADVTFSGSTSSQNSALGGIVGQLESSNHPIYVKNCVNYGSVTHSGTSFWLGIGGIVGGLSGSSSNYKYIYNCLNYGTITHSGTSSYTLRFGGISGHNERTYIENCVSAGKITAQNIPYRGYIGSIVGSVDSGTFISYSYYTSDLSGYDFCGYAIPSPRSSYTLGYDNTTFKLSGTVSVGNYTGTSLISALNAAADYHFLRDYSKWLLNKEKKSVTFTINSRTSPITMSSQIILLPNLASGGNIIFDGWYNDDKCSNTLESFEITEDKTLYSKFEENTNDYTITFDTRREGSSVALITAQFGTVVSLPSDLTREHCSVAWWENEYECNVGFSLTMPARNFTLYAVWKCTHIATPDDLIDFSKLVNSGTNYSGTTVFLDSDLSLSGGTLEPIGDYSDQFLGVFDGQGHIISDLKMNSSSQYTGLFGYSEGLTIRNVVLDSSCSITSSFSGSSSVYAGGIIGECYADNEQCNIENSVIMADVSFSGDISDMNYLYLGGIAGYLSYYYSSGYLVYLKNCANYGSVAYSGTGYKSYIGGVVGDLSGSSPGYIYIYNCLNHGAITHSGTTSGALRLGGISGYSYYAYIENCVSAGEISTQNTPSEDSYVGNIVGYVEPGTSIVYCYYTNSVGGYPINGTGKILNTTGTPTSATTVNLPLVTNLNSYASDNEWNGWLLNMNNAPVTFKVNGYAGFTLNSQVILLPNIATSGSGTFTWFSDSSFTTPFSSSSVSEGTTLYGTYGVTVTVTFDANGGDKLAVTSKKVVLNSAYGTLPEASRAGHMFLGWFTKKSGGTKVTSKTPVSNSNDHTLYAQWTDAQSDSSSKTIASESKIEPASSSESWTDASSKTIASESKIEPASSSETPTSLVEIVFDGNDLTDGEISGILSKYTNATYTIKGKDNTNKGETKVVIKFNDVEKAKELVTNINGYSGSDKSIIKSVGYSVAVIDDSISPALIPLVKLISLFM